jgi:hypothetical protein
MVLRGSLAQNRTRTVLAVVAIALGVALGYAVQLINAAAVNELAQGVQTLSGDADLELRGPRGGFAEAIYPGIAQMAEVAVASPVVEVDAKVEGGDMPLKILGLDVFRAGYVQPGLIPVATDRLDTLRPMRCSSVPRRNVPRRHEGTRFASGSRSRTWRCAWQARRVGGQSAARGDGHRGPGRVRSRRVAEPDRLAAASGCRRGGVRRTLARDSAAGTRRPPPETAIAAGASLSRSYR